MRQNQYITFFYINKMQQNNLQSSYNVSIITAQPANFTTASSNVQLQIGPGLFLANSLINLYWTSTEANTDMVLVRTDMCPLFRNCLITWDGVVRGNYSNLPIVQKAYFDYKSDTEEFVGDVTGGAGAAGTGFTPLTFKKFKIVGQGTGAGITYSQAFPFSYFFPGILQENQKTFYIKNQLTINLTLQGIDNNAFSLNGLVTAPRSELLTVGAACTDFNLQFIGKNIPSLYMPDRVLSFIQQNPYISTNTTLSFNDNIALSPDQVSEWQSIGIVNQLKSAVLTDETFQAISKVEMRRNQQLLIQADQSQGSIREQFQFQSMSNNKGALAAIFLQQFQGIQITTNCNITFLPITNQLAGIEVHLAYQYSMINKDYDELAQQAMDIGNIQITSQP